MILVVILAMISNPVSAFAFQKVQKDSPLSQGVQYKQYAYNNTNLNTINHLAVDLGDPTTEVQLGMAAAVNGKESTTSMATRHSREGNRVVGAINASFYNMTEGYPLFLLAKNQAQNPNFKSKERQDWLRIAAYTCQVINSIATRLDESQIDKDLNSLEELINEVQSKTKTQSADTKVQ